MANTTFNGPVRSENGFQEWNGSAWVPVAGGGGGGGTTFINLVSEYVQPYDGATDNRYSDNFNNNPPTGPTAGTIVQLPDMEVGDTCLIRGNGGNNQDAWAIRLPSPAGTALSFYDANVVPMSTITGNFPEYTLTTYMLYSDSSEPPDTFYAYGPFFNGGTSLKITRAPNFDFPGIGAIATFIITGIPITSSNLLGDPYVYPFSQVIPAP